MASESQKHVFTVIICVLCFCRRSSAAATGDIRLVGGNKPSEGRVEIYNNGTWGTYCGDSMDIQIARVVCRKAGYPGAARSFQNNKEFGSGKGPVYYNGYMSCVGDEKNLGECHFMNYKFTQCSHKMDAGVICIEPGYEGCYSTDSHFQSSLSVISSTTVDDMDVDKCLAHCQSSDEAYAAVSGHGCFCSDNLPDNQNSTTGKAADKNCNITCSGNSHQICGGTKFYSFFSTTVGFCDSLARPENGSIDTMATRFGTIVTFSCFPGFEIEGAKRVQCVQSGSSGFKWDGLVPTCKETVPMPKAPSRNTSAGVIVGIISGVLVVALIMTLSFIYCRQRNRYDHKPLHIRSSWSPIHLQKDQLDAEPHMYETTSQGGASLHSHHMHRAVTPGGASEHEYASYHEFHDLVVEDTTLLHSPLDKVPNGRLALKDDDDTKADGSIMVINELYNPTPNERDQLQRVNPSIYEISGDFRHFQREAACAPQEPPLPVPRKPAINPEDHIYEPEPLGDIVTINSRDHTYSSADYAYAEVDPRDSGLGTMSLGLRLQSLPTSDSGIMVENQLYLTADSQDIPPSSEDVDKTEMVDNILYHA